jgi:hypothetical protein
VHCRKITSSYLRGNNRPPFGPGNRPPIPYCSECFTAELTASHAKLLARAKAAGFGTVEAWQDWIESDDGPLAAIARESAALKLDATLGEETTT